MSSVVLAASALGLAWPASASAVNYAAPDGRGDACSQQAPCPIGVAFSTVAAGEDILLDGGLYNLGTGGVTASKFNDVRPADDTANVVITGSGSGPLVRIEGDEASIQDVFIIGSPAGPALSLRGDGAPLAERVYVQNQAASGVGCGVTSGLIRDSVCRGSGTESQSDAITIDGGGSLAQVTLRNVTAYSDNGSGLRLLATGESPPGIELDAVNVIADGLGGRVSRDIEAFGQNIDADFAFSNYGAVEKSLIDSSSSITPSGSPTNQGAEPIFEDAAGGEFAEAEGSPTIDAGDSNADQLGQLDLERDPRVQGTIDIGAYETELPDTTPPALEITRGPAKRTRSRAATFRFSASDDSAGELAFSCGLDGMRKTPCMSVVGYGGLRPGRHVFEVTVTDAAGNEATKRYAWTVVKKKRRR